MTQTRQLAFPDQILLKRALAIWQWSQEDFRQHRRLPGIILRVGLERTKPRGPADRHLNRCRSVGFMVHCSYCLRSNFRIATIAPEIRVVLSYQMLDPLACKMAL